ncbi:uncharacterized protein LOC121381517 [Gigantopelta aegis]|uniref:uncharacterized protein LOC121381517 n=1 Tax=Gigantopelta aegis TaxID=1735272 RepID=UPI001B887DB9|nr:uncharacterized protein LOC121381517 [Gigantopelta aegis]
MSMKPALTLNINLATVLALKGSRPAAIKSSRSSTITVIACGNAVGTCMPPFIIFKGKRKQTELSEKCTAGTEIRMSETGWSNTELFKDFLETHFLKYSMGSDADYKLLLYDAHASHINIGMIEWAREHKIVLFVLPPHTSHVTQPLDVGCFGPFKRHLYAECAAFVRTNSIQTITKYNLGELVWKVYPTALSSKNIISSFKKTGIYPLLTAANFPCGRSSQDTIHKTGLQVATQKHFLKKKIR